MSLNRINIMVFLFLCVLCNQEEEKPCPWGLDGGPDIFNEKVC